MFYVYIYLDPRKLGTYSYEGYDFNFEPFYVGKGMGTRMYAHLKDVVNGKFPSHRINRIKSIFSEGLSPIILKVRKGLSDSEACRFEEELIRLIGRRELNSGPLTNQTFGGDGVSGEGLTKEQRKERFGRVFSLETRRKIGSREYPTGPDHPNWGKTLSEKTRRKIGARPYGPRSDDVKQRISLKLKGKKKPDGFAAKVSELKKGNTNVRGKKIHTLEGMRARTMRMIKRTLTVLRSRGLPFTEENYSSCKLYSNYPSFRTAESYLK